MKETVIAVENLGKEYRIGAQKEPYTTLRESLVRMAWAPIRRIQNLLTGNSSGASDLTQSYWALNDVSFEVKRGEIVGVIGRNGAGKSTLLKVLTRITDPSRGCVTIQGRVASLLEVGTGFHPELTGRENVFLNGAILGMRKNEITRKFDDIVAFAEVEKFIDTPVKHYSTGMHVRLAFAVAAHLEPEILLIDEVLAVGDARFQSKCLNKMKDIGQQGRTILFVSHNMPSISTLCDRVIVMDAGQKVMDGPADQGVRAYLNAGITTPAERVWENDLDAPGNEKGKLRAVRVLNEVGEITEVVDVREPVIVEIEFEAYQGGREFLPNLCFTNEEGLIIFCAQDLDPAWRRKPRPTGKYKSTMMIPGNLLNPGKYFIGVNLITLNPENKVFNVEHVLAFEVLDSQDSDTARGDYKKGMRGAIRPMLEWTTQYSPEFGNKNGSPDDSVTWSQKAMRKAQA